MTLLCMAKHSARRSALVTNRGRVRLRAQAGRVPGQLRLRCIAYSSPCTAFLPVAVAGLRGQYSRLPAVPRPVHIKG